MFPGSQIEETAAMTQTKETQVTSRQREIYEFLRERITNRGYGPSVREIGARFGIRSPNGVLYHLKALEKKGLITRESHTSRAISLNDPVGQSRREQLTTLLSAWCTGQLQLRQGLDTRATTRIRQTFDSLREDLEYHDDSSSAQEEATWTSEKNARRCQLIDREIEGTIADEERIELDELQRQAVDHRDRVAPLPIEGARRLHRELLTKKRERDELPQTY